MAKEFTDSQLEKISRLVHSHYDTNKPFLSREQDYDRVKDPDVFKRVDNFKATDGINNIPASPPLEAVTNEIGVLHFSIFKIHQTNKETGEHSINYSFGTDLAFVRYSDREKFFRRLEDIMDRVDENTTEEYVKVIEEIADEDGKFVNRNP